MTDSTPPRSGFAAEVIARNAADGAAQKGPAMTKDIKIQGKDRTIAAQLFDQIRGIDTQAANDIQDWFESRYTLTPINRPTDILIAELIAQSERQSSGPLEGAGQFVELLASRGFEIRRITDAPSCDPLDESYDEDIGGMVQVAAFQAQDHDEAYAGTHLRKQFADAGWFIAVHEGGA